MAVDMFLKLGDIKGESADKTNKEWIDVLAWSWGGSQSGTTHLGSGGGAGKVSVNDLSVTKYVDSASPALFKALCNGKHYGEAKLTVRKAGEKPLEYMKVTMTDVLISSYSTGGSGGEDRITENVSLNFAKVKVEYTPQKADGTGGAAIEAVWDIAKNTEE
jgi:type VI secretion system secreted protein Hcp